MAFTDSKIRSIKAGESRNIVWEDGGTCLGVRVSPSGKKSFVFMYRFQGKARMMTIGNYPQITLAEARMQVAKARSDLTQEIDPGEKLLEAKSADRDAPTIGDLAHEFLEKWSKPRKKSWREDQRIIEKDILPNWEGRRARDIKRRDVILLLDKIVERGAPVAANRTLALIAKMFRFGVERSMVEFSPAIAITPLGKETSRDRVLSEAEIKSFWNGLENAGMSDGTRLALKLQLATLQRRGEVVSMEWSDVDMDSDWWIIPAEKAKNALPHRVPLSPIALRILSEAKELSGDSKWVFPSPVADQPITGRAVTKAVKQNQQPIGISNVRPHDLRRTGASYLAGMGVPRLTISKLLNHVESGITAVYDRHSYDNEKRQALDTWARRLESILTGQTGKIIALPR